MPISDEEYRAMVARVSKPKSGVESIAASKGVDKESDLHGQIIAHCKSKGWYYVHSAMHKATTNGVGVADFIIAADKGRTFWIEAKAEGKKPTKEQSDAIVWLHHLNHIAAIVYNFDQYLTVVTTHHIP